MKPGDVIFSSVLYDEPSNSYNMYIANQNVTGKSVKTNIPVQPTNLVFQHLYFVTEHQPNSCSEYPASGGIVFHDINVEVDGAPVVPNWTTATEDDACNCLAHIDSPSTISFTWSTS